MLTDPTHTSDVELHFDQPQRQAPSALLLILAKLGRYILGQAWPLLIIYFFSRKSNVMETYLAYIAIGGAIVSAVLSVAAYLNFYFHTTDEELVMKRGILGKTRLSIPFGRIQTVNFRESILHQLMGVVSVEVETAGAEDKEFVVTALSKPKAHALRQHLLRLKSEHSHAASDEQDETVETIGSTEVEPAEELILQLSIQDLLKIGLSSNHLQAAAILLGSVMGLYFTIYESLNGLLIQNVESVIHSTVKHWWQGVLIGVPVLLLAGFILNMVRTVLRFFQLRFFRSSNGFTLKAGLLTRIQQSAILSKVQLLQWHDNPIYRYFHLLSLQIKQASSKEVEANNAVVVPGCNTEQLARVKNTYFNDAGIMENLPAYGISHKIILRRVFFLGFLPTLPLMLFTYNILDLYALCWLILVPAQYFLSRIYHRQWAYVIHEQALQIQYGVWNLKRSLLRWHKVQTVEVQQSYYQRRHGLATLNLSTASGQVRIPFIRLQAARDLRDFAAFKVESSKEQWM